MTTPHASKHESITDDIDLLLTILPSDMREWLERQNELESLLEIICDLGRAPEARYPGRSQAMPNRLATPEPLRPQIPRIKDLVCRTVLFHRRVPLHSGPEL